MRRAPSACSDGGEGGESTKYPVFLGLALCALEPGCLVEADNGPGPPPAAVGSGRLVVDWTIDGDKNPDQCDQSNATTIDITVTTASGAPAGEFQQSCQAFATTIDLPAGNYDADAVLLDPGGRDRTTAVQLGAFTIFGDDQLTVPIDFPASSFF
jgi:hypothetical protein